MAHDVFVSYSTKDKAVADAAVAALEGRGVRCWIAPRDILAGSHWGAAIVKAISESRAMLLIYSASANASIQIQREVERAADRNLPIVPFRIEDVRPSAELEYFLSTPHWLDAVGPKLKPGVQRLAEVVERVLAGSAGTGGAGARDAARTARPAGEPEAAAATAPAGSGHASRRRHRALAAGLAAVAALAIGGVAYVGWPGPGNDGDGNAATNDEAATGSPGPASTTRAAPIDRTDARAVAAAFLKAFQAEDQETLLALAGPGARQDLLARFARGGGGAGPAKGGRGPRGNRRVLGPRARAWDGRLREVRYLPPVGERRWRALAAFADPSDGEVAAMTLVWVDGKWWFVESGEVGVREFARARREPPTAAELRD